MKLLKNAKNPIFVKNDNNSWENLCVLNPAVIYDEERKKFVMLYRAAGDDKTHYIYLGMAESDDGINFYRVSDEPIMSPDFNGADGGCIEDPRLVKMGDYYYLTYAARPYAPGQYWSKEWKPLYEAPPNGPTYLKTNATLTHLAISKNLKDWKKLGRMTDARLDDRDVMIFPETINGKYFRLSRPVAWCGKGYPCKNPSIWIAQSDDLLEWEKPTLFLEGVEWWEDFKVGASCPPIKTKYGWFHIYHGVSSKDRNYRVGAIICDLENPEKIIARTKDFLMEPETNYEKNGFYEGCVFPTGNVVHEGILYVYYGAADKYICVATVNFDELLESMMNEQKKEN